MYAPTAYTTDDDASLSSQANLQTTSTTLHLPSGAVTETPDMSVEIGRRTRACWMRIRRYLRELYDQPKVTLSLKTRMVKAEAIEALMYGCSTWTLRQEHYAKLRTVHHRVLLRMIGTQRKRPDHRMTSYNRSLGITLREHLDNFTHDGKTFVREDAHPDERRPVAKANRLRKPRGCSTERTGWEGQRVDRLRTERHQGVWHSEGLESDGVKG